ncbi:MAG: hypothetical protein ACTH8F_07645 [Microbacterium sp.]|uniref:hypothetical protein n=1 Tax=Microbacterium sp. TaxID=51671 RepID=UPI003F9758A6
MKTKKAIFGTVGALAVVTVGLVSGSAVAALASSPDSPEYSTNASDQTYGSAKNATHDSEPDLIQAIATNGKTGYVKKVELDDTSGQPTNPEEAVAYMQSKSYLNARTITVYESDGKTEIGEFVISPGQPGVVEDDTAK